MKNCLVPLALLVVLLSSQALRAADAPPGVDSKLAEDIHTLLQVSGSAQLSEQIVDQIILIVRQQYPKPPPTFWDDFRKEISTSEYLDQMIPIYASHFSDEEVQEMINFYRSPVGRKLVQEQPMMMHESTKIGQKWGYQISQRISQRLQERGYLQK